MPSTSTTIDPNTMPAYAAEEVGAFTVPGPHHRDTGSQDSFWPSAENGLATQRRLSPRDIAQHGRLYILADGVSLCADGNEASRLAVETTGSYYYQTAGAYPNSAEGRMQRLEDAIWQAHLRVAGWDEKFFCWRADSHPDGVAHHFKKEQMTQLSPPLCPLCVGIVVGLQSTILAVLVRGQHLTMVGVGDCSAFRLPQSTEYGVEWIFTPQDGQFLGMASLTRDMVIGQTFILDTADSVLLTSDGLVKVLNGLHPDLSWHSFLRDQLDGEYAERVTETVLDLHGWRLSQPRRRKLHDDLTLVAVGLVEGDVQERQTGEAIALYDELLQKQSNGGLVLH